jgi:hypothetical protein
MNNRSTLDAIGQFLIALHGTIGHQATARFLGMPVGDMKECILCRYNRGEVELVAVIDRIGTG